MEMATDNHDPVEEEGFAFSMSAQEALSGACLCLGLRRATRQLSRIYDDALAAHGLTIGQFGIIGHIEALEAPAIQTLADHLGMDQSALSRSLKPIEKAGLIASRTDENDGRRRVLVLTREGRQRFNQVSEAWRAAQERMQDTFGANQTRDLRSRLSALSDKIKEL